MFYFVTWYISMQLFIDI
jgi:hypothetical protein